MLVIKSSVLPEGTCTTEVPTPFAFHRGFLWGDCSIDLSRLMRPFIVHLVDALSTGPDGTGSAECRFRITSASQAALKMKPLPLGR